MPQSIWARSGGWIKERLASLQLVPSLSYASAFAAIAVTVSLSLSRDVQVTQVDGQSKLTFRMAGQNASFAMVPVTLGVAAPAAPRASDNPTFTPAHYDSSATRYVLANNSHGAYDATVAF